MANVFLSETDRDIETAIMLEQAIIHNIGNAVAYTDGDKVFINTDDNLFNILPAYDHKMLKWLLWHERYHKELRHHNRYFKYLSELREDETLDEFKVDKNEINIIMDILVHDSLSKMFPELIETAANNLAQFRNRNSLGYTFKTFTLEEMLDEYANYKSEQADDTDTSDKTKGDGEGEESEGEEAKEDGRKKGHAEGKTDTPSKSKDKPEDGEPEMKTDTPEPEHDKTDWSQLEKLDDKEFITEEESEDYIYEINRIKRMKAKLGKLTETLNGLVTSQRSRTYTMPSHIHAGAGIMLKGSKPGRVALYLCFDASGSMGSQMETFKEIISKSIPQAMTTPTEWFSGYSPADIERKCHNKDGRNSDYYKGQFKDFMTTHATSGYNDDGDRTIELCYLAEQKGYTPIGITDGGGTVSWSESMIKRLNKTILVGQNEYWLNRVKEINPKIQILHI